MKPVDIEKIVVIFLTTNKMSAMFVDNLIWQNLTVK